MYDVAGFPTILYFNYGKNEQKYQGARSQEAFTAFMQDPVRGLADFQNSNQIEEASVDETWDVPGGELVTQVRLSAGFCVKVFFCMYQMNFTGQPIQAYNWLTFGAS